MSDQNSAYDSPTGYAPAPAPHGNSANPSGAGVPPQPGPEPVQPGSSNKKKIIIIGVVVAILVLCCCIGAGVVAFVSLNPGKSDTLSTTTDLVPEDTDTVPTQSDDPRVQEWLDWSPEVINPLYVAPADSDELVLEALGIAAPGFDMQEVTWWEGYYDETQDWYYSDAFYVRAKHPSSGLVSAAVELWIQSDQMISEDVAFDPDATDIVTTVADGSRELLYSPQWGPSGFDLATDDDVALWQQIGRDWPGAVVVDGQEATDGSGAFAVDLTKWSAYAVVGDYPVVLASYENLGGEWSLLEWEYLYPDGWTGMEIPAI